MYKEDYIDYVTKVKRFSSRTRDIYSGILDEFIEYSEASGSDSSLLSALVPSVLRSYEVHLMDARKLDPRTVNLHLSVISGFCRYLVKVGALASNPVRLVHRPKVEKRLPVFYREESMDEYFRTTSSDVSEENLDLIGEGDMLSRELLGRRLSHLVVTILFSTGIRRSELIGINVGDVDFSRKVIRVRGKGDKEREIPLADALSKEILLYLDAVKTFDGRRRAADEPLLQTLKGKRLYPVAVDRIIKEELGQVGSITGRKSPHVLRHTLATSLLNEGTDLNSIKELLGHSSLAATQVYTHNSIEKLKNVYQTAHPRAKSGGKNGD